MVRLTSIEGNSQRLDGGAMFGNAPRAVWEKWLAPDERGRIPLACRALLIECDGKRILCEAGIGAFFEPKMADRFGVQDADRHLLIENLKALGVEEGDVDYVILSHLHFDHAGGLLPTYDEIRRGNRGLHFPNATYVVGKEAWDRARGPHPRDRASFIEDLPDKLEESGRLTVVEGDKLMGVLEDRLSFFYTHGHTPGHMHTVFKGDQGTVVFAGDLIPGTQWVHLAITMGYDRFAERIVDEKRDLYEMAVPQDWWFFYTHDVSVPLSRVEQDERGRYRPRDPQTELKSFPL